MSKMINEGMKLGKQLSFVSTLTIFPDNINRITVVIPPLQGCKARITVVIPLL